MKFNIEVELADGDYCNGCPCLNEQHDFCQHYPTMDRLKTKTQYCEELTFDFYIRPDICKQQYKGDNTPITKHNIK